MTYRTIEPGLARLIGLGLDHELQDRVPEWKANLAQGRVTTEMRDVFVGLGWLSSARDSRLGDEIEVDPSTAAVEVPIREPEEPGRKLKPKREDDSQGQRPSPLVPGEIPPPPPDE